MTAALPSITQPFTLGFALKAFGQRCLAKLAGYNAAYPTPTTTVGSRIGTNSNSTFARMQAVGMMWTAEDVAKNSPIAGGYLAQRQNYCSSMIRYKADTGDEKLDDSIEEYLHGNDGSGGIFSTMGMDCSMQDAFLRTADLELPVRGDAGLVWHRAWDGSLHLMEFSADQLGEIYSYTTPRVTSLAAKADGTIVEVAGVNDVTYYCGRYIRNGFCVAYKIYERVEAWYGNPGIYAAQDVIYFRDPASFRGQRGVTIFANAIQHMEKGENLFQIGMDAALRQSKTAYAVFNERGAPDELTYDNQTGIDGRVTQRERINSGPLVEYFYTGDKIQATSADSPGPELIAGCEFSDQRVALALRLNYAFLVSPEKVGGAPSRLEVEKATKEFDRIKNDIHRPALNRIRNTVLLDAMNKGVFPYDSKVLRGYFNLPISPTVDAYYDAKAEITSLRSGLESPQEICAKTNRNWDVVRRMKKQAAKQVAMDAEDANRELKEAGYKPTVTGNDIMQLTDNPQTEMPAGEPEPKPEPAKALMSAYLGDVSVSTLPEGTRDEVMRILGLKNDPKFLRVVKYGMVADELERMAEPHNLEAAQKHLRYCTNGSCAEEVHANTEKHILINNGRIVDGHHYLAKALKGRVSKSLHVVDLTPARFQAALKSDDSDGVWRTIRGRKVFIAEGQSLEDAMKNAGIEKDKDDGSPTPIDTNDLMDENLYWRLDHSGQEFDDEFVSSNQNDPDYKEKGLSTWNSLPELLKNMTGGNADYARGNVEIIAFRGKLMGEGLDGEPVIRPLSEAARFNHSDLGENDREMKNASKYMESAKELLDWGWKRVPEKKVSRIRKND